MSTVTAGEGPGLAAGVIAVGAFTAATGAWGAVALADAPGYTGSLNPIATAVDLVTGAITWTSECTLWAGAEVAVVAVAVLAIAVAIRRRRGRAKTLTDRARHLAHGRALHKLGPKAVKGATHRLAPSIDATDTERHGIFIGNAVIGKMPLRSTWEDMMIDIRGPRRGKSVTVAIPAICAAPGPCVATSRKGDIVDATREVRAELGDVWVFDPMRMLDQAQDWWWDPLEGVDTITKARRLAESFTFSAAGGGQRDEYFAPKSDDLVANLLLAAACAGKGIEAVYRWSTRPRDDEPVQALHDAGHHLPADAIAGTIALPEQTRGGVYGGAEKSLTCLTEPATLTWVTPQSGKRQLHVDAFAASTDTLYLLSEDGAGAPAPLVAALTDSIWRAAEIRARQSPSRRLDPPLLSVLDEAANICKIKNLPNLYSFYGSTGIPIVTILQSYTQGVGVWGKEGMGALWSAANMRVLGGGVADPEILKQVSDYLGLWDRPTRTRQVGSGSRSTSYTTNRQNVADVADLVNLPDGQVVVLASSAAPTLAHTRPWWDSPWASGIKASLATWDPAAKPAAEGDNARG